MRAGLDVDGTAHIERLRPFLLSLFGYVLKRAIPLAAFRAAGNEIGPDDVLAALRYVIMDGITAKQVEEVAMARIAVRPIDYDIVPESLAREMMVGMGGTAAEVVESAICDVDHDLASDREEVDNDGKSADDEKEELARQLADSSIRAQWVTWLQSPDRTFAERLLARAADAHLRD